MVFFLFQLIILYKLKMFADQEAPEWLPANVMRFARYVNTIYEFL